MKLQFNLFPGGLSKALTMSYDDGQKHDIRLAGIFDQYGIKGTFHLNSAMINAPGFLSPADVKHSLRNHEVSAHSVTHPHLERLHLPMVIEELFEDRKRLEKLVDYPVRGMSYPYGTYSQEIIAPLQSVGIEYSRTVHSTKQFDMPLNFMEWHPTCHHIEDLHQVWERFTMEGPSQKLRLCYVWGHSYEFAQQNNWELIETFCQQAGGHSDIWYATNIEIYDYVTALYSLKLSADKTIIRNNSAIDVWVSINDQPVQIKGGSMMTTK
ncbi:polysaccharide deacetylase family protein [Paenibacillus sp. FSL R7-0048]|uniref:polysaccharide deacetylase family protein n=1 Tax=Paenibacillus TaxID=44249 RepID=UPI00096E1285|nr:polysaccharide deacetylase family protein [Paenibacillus odorifer]OMD62363.1 polysaccharide deacetylase [Paenibacillus odorifer]